ncbi:MAG: succinylglutamate desuccinylase [Gammaproteobacteria bacterium]|jgi:succinylglutamate desuccinylase|nr:succinylglutamate desuccinylase [Gammaproteobacteria bacterium]MBT4493175.1 succinylglutamate desuccinylase [Gammaproteobacteria bacterium]MBT7371442.1 succinylglutamate desuccinylase [Gammaproteobacteria bacterium]
MSSTQTTIQLIQQPDNSLLGETHVAFLKNLGGPSWITIEGKDRTRRRVVVTLLHGNEPSGLHAVHRLLKEGVQPETDLGILVAAADAALYEPILSHRYIPGEQDLNRCFRSPYTTNQGELAAKILDIIHDFNPEGLIDTHNTSSHSEAFSIAAHKTIENAGLASLFTDSLIILDQNLGTLLEKLDSSIPAITVEFGGFMDPNADWLARESLHRFAVSHLLTSPNVNTINYLTHPLRLETQRHLTVTYSSSIDANADLTIINTIDQLNFRRIEPGTALGWFKEKQHRNLVAPDRFGNDQYESYFDQNDGLLCASRPMTIFMATTDPVVANTDCLLYFTPEV